MSWYKIADYNVSINASQNTVVYLHIGCPDKADSKYSIQINNERYSLKDDLHEYSDIRSVKHVNKNPSMYYSEKVEIAFSDTSKAMLLVEQLDKAISGGVMPSYNKDSQWISIPTPRNSYKLELTDTLPD